MILECNFPYPAMIQVHRASDNVVIASGKVNRFGKFTATVDTPITDMPVAVAVFSHVSGESLWNAELTTEGKLRYG